MVPPSNAIIKFEVGSKFCKKLEVGNQFSKKLEVGSQLCKKLEVTSQLFKSWKLRIIAICPLQISFHAMSKLGYKRPLTDTNYYASYTFFQKTSDTKFWLAPISYSDVPLS